jgi:hypothetical protein
MGDKFIDEIDTAIRIREKVVLVLCENSIKSVWVEDEVTTAYEEERKRGTTVLFPIRLDDAVVETRADVTPSGEKNPGPVPGGLGSVESMHGAI